MEATWNMEASQPHRFKASRLSAKPALASSADDIPMQDPQTFKQSAVCRTRGFARSQQELYCPSSSSTALGFALDFTPRA